MLALILTRLEHYTTSLRILEVPPQEPDTIQLDTATESDSPDTLYLYDARRPLGWYLRLPISSSHMLPLNV
jgi:hypothetical protein